MQATTGDDAPGFLGRFDALHELAARETGLSDFGDPAYRANLRKLLECYDREAMLGESGRAATEGMLITSLRGRLYSTERLASHPECLSATIERPLVIAGLPRTGSTALHKLLAADPEAQALEYWLGCEPDVRPPRSEWPEHPSFRRAQASLARIYASSPDLKTAHSMQPGEADECRLLFMQDFLNLTYSFNATIPSFEAWVLEQDMRPAYRRYRDNLKLIGARDAGKRWIVKNSSHLWALPALEETFPDCCVVQTHRSPFDWISSISSLVHKSRTIYEPTIERRAVGEQQLRQWSRIVRRSLEARAANPALDARILDIHYDHFVRDPIATVRQIHDHFGLRWSNEAEQRIRAWGARNPPEKHGVHRYTADEYGLTESAIAEAFGDYLAWEQRLRAAG